MRHGYYIGKRYNRFIMEIAGYKHVPSHCDIPDDKRYSAEWLRTLSKKQLDEFPRFHIVKRSPNKKRPSYYLHLDKNREHGRDIIGSVTCNPANRFMEIEIKRLEVARLKFLLSRRKIALEQVKKRLNELGW